jgi:hypothetical protein
MAQSLAEEKPKTPDVGQADSFSRELWQPIIWIGVMDQG